MFFFRILFADVISLPFSLSYPNRTKKEGTRETHHIIRQSLLIRTEYIETKNTTSRCYKRFATKYNSRHVEWFDFLELNTCASDTHTNNQYRNIIIIINKRVITWRSNRNTFMVAQRIDVYKIIIWFLPFCLWSFHFVSADISSSFYRFIFIYIRWPGSPLTCFGHPKHLRRRMGEKERQNKT